MSAPDLNVLLVEDNPADAFLTETAFELADVSVRLHVTRDGEEAVDFVRHRGRFEDAPTPDLILLDLNLPRKNGFEVLRDLKGDAQLRRIPIVMLTTSAAPHDILQAYDLHVNAYTTKPTSLEALIGFVQSLEQYWVIATRLPSRISAAS